MMLQMPVSVRLQPLSCSRSANSIAKRLCPPLQVSAPVGAQVKAGSRRPARPAPNAPSAASPLSCEADTRPPTTRMVASKNDTVPGRSKCRCCSSQVRALHRRMHVWGASQCGREAHCVGNGQANTHKNSKRLHSVCFTHSQKSVRSPMSHSVDNASIMLTPRPLRLPPCNACEAMHQRLNAHSASMHGSWLMFAKTADRHGH